MSRRFCETWEQCATWEQCETWEQCNGHTHNRG